MSEREQHMCHPTKTYEPSWPSEKETDRAPNPGNITYVSDAIHAQSEGERA